MIENTYWGSVEHFLKFKLHRSNVKVTKWPNIGTKSALEPQLFSVVDRNICQRKHLLGQCEAFMKFWELKVNVTNMGKKAVLELCANYKGGFWRSVPDLGIFSQPAGGGILSTFQHQILSTFYSFQYLLFNANQTQGGYCTHTKHFSRSGIYFFTLFTFCLHWIWYFVQPTEAQEATSSFRLVYLQCRRKCFYYLHHWSNETLYHELEQGVLSGS